jgi:hypothetical protein
VKLTDDFDQSLARIRAIGENIRKMLGEVEPKVLDNFIFTEQEENAWFDAEPAFTKRIATPLPTKQRRRVTSFRVLLT